MKWDEIDKILYLDRQEPLAAGVAELFRRVITEGRQRLAGRDQDWAYLSVRASPFVAYPGLEATNDRGRIDVECGPDTSGRLRNQPVRFHLESPAFSAALPTADWTEEEMDAVSLRLALDLYEQVRVLLSQAPHRDWWLDWQAARSFPFLGHVTSGTVELRIGEAAMGPLPERDHQLLAGERTEEAEVKDVKTLPGLVPYNLVRGSTSTSEGATGAKPGSARDGGR